MGRLGDLLAGARRRSRDRQDLAAVDTAVAAALTELGPEGCHDPAFLARELRECLVPTRFSLSAANQDGASGSLRLLRALADPPVVPFATALELARAADALIARTEPLAGTAADVGLAARIQSSFGRKGRLLTTVARVARPRSVLELGTAFGMSAAFLARAAPEARIVTVDPSTAHAGHARDLLESVGASNVELLELTSEAAVGPVGDRLSSIDLLFHDARHSREAYVEDFHEYEPLLAPGAVVLYDDIDWRPPSGPDPQTYAGWTEVAQHERVGASVEIDGLYGLLELR